MNGILEFRKSTLADIDEICQIVENAKAFLKGNGVSQWQRGTYPDKAIFTSDVAQGIGYVVTIDQRVAAACAVTYTSEPSYDTLRDGFWLSAPTETYATIHRSAVAGNLRGKGIAGFLFHSVIEMAKKDQVGYVRVDTHMDNKPMQHALEKSGFIKCGILTLVDGDEVGDLRYGYEYRI